MTNSPKKSKMILLQKCSQSSSFVRSNPLLSLVMFQFTIYGIMGLLGFVGWLLSLVFQLSAPGYLGYITGHLERWAAKVSLWGLPILLVGLISLGVPILIRKNEFLAFILGNFAFFLGFMINMIVAYNPPAHLFVGALVGWLLLMPLIFYVIRLKKSSEEIHSQEKISVNK